MVTFILVFQFRVSGLIMKNLLNILVVCVAFSFPSLIKGQSSIGCNVDGECKGSLYMDVTNQETVGECLTQCQSTIGCQFWTYYRESKGCLGFVSCDHLSSESCTDCVSGDKECEPYQCNIQGRCSGTLVRFLQAPDVDYCAEACHTYTNCTWWTYDQGGSSKFCTLMGDCPVLDETCLTCISGEAGCWIESTLPPMTEGEENGTLWQCIMSLFLIWRPLLRLGRPTSI